MSKKIIPLLLLCSFLFTGCVMNKLSPADERITLNTDVRGRNVRIDIRKGEQWSYVTKAGPFRFNIIPQIVIWAEDSQGRLVQTLYITGADFKKMRHAEKSSKGALFFEECFPLWAAKLEQSGGRLPSKENPYPDAVTSPTPKAGFTLHTVLADPAEGLTLYAEINQSLDTNAVYTEEINDWAGQPALIYSCRISPDRRDREMTLLGHSGLLVSEPAVYEDLSGFDTALKQVDSITVSF